VRTCAWYVTEAASPQLALLSRLRLELPHHLSEPLGNKVRATKKADDVVLFVVTALESRNDFEDRRVNVVVDPRGCRGKSTCASLARLHYGALDLPPISDHKELIQIVADILIAKQERHPGLVFVDCPRSIDQMKMGPIFIAIEQIKKGYVADVRYQFKEWDFDSPRVWVFMNHELDYLSTDRFRIWPLSPLNSLLPYVPIVPNA
jgi:hypothetical protein